VASQNVNAISLVSAANDRIASPVNTNDVYIKGNNLAVGAANIGG